MTRRAAALWAPLALFAACAATPAAFAQPQPLPAAACPPGAAAAGTAWLRLGGEHWRNVAPERARQRACARVAAEGDGFDPRLELAQALNAVSDTDTAAAVVAPLATAALPDGLAAARLQVVLADIEYARGRHASAGEHAERALAQLSARDPGATRPYVAALIHRATAARALRKPGALQTAEQALAEAERVLRRAGLARTHAMAEVLNERTMLANASWNLPQMLRYARLEQALVRELGGADSPSQIDALVTLGVTTSMMRRYDESIAYFREARRIGRLAPQAFLSGQVGTLSNFSTTLVEVGRLDEALAAADEAVALALRTWGAGSPQTMTPLERRQQVLQEQRRYGEARQMQQRLLAVLAAQGPQMPLYRRLRVIERAASFYQSINDLDAAEEQLLAWTRELQDGDPQLAFWRGRLARRQALQAAARGRWADAEALYAQALQQLGATYAAGHPTMVGLEAQLCEAQVRGGSDPAACGRLAARLDGLDEAAAGERALAALALAAHADAQGRDGDAAEQWLRAVAAAQAPHARRLLWRALDGLAQRVRAGGQRDKAVALAKLALSEIETDRAGLRGAPELHSRFLDDKYGVYRRLADWLAEDGRIGEALEAHRLLKGQEQRDFVRGRLDADAAATPGPRRLAAEAQWLRALPQVPARDAPWQPPKEALQALLATERKTTAAWRQALAQPLAVPAATAAVAPAAAPPTAGELRATLFQGPAHLNMVLETRRQTRLLRLPSDPQALSRDIGRLLAAIEARDDALPLLKALHARLAAPLADEARRHGAARWLLQLDGDLRYVPFAALFDGQQHLVERWTIVQQAQAGPSPGAAPGRPWLQAFGSTRGADGLPPLQGVAGEICAIVDGSVAGAACAAQGGAVPGQGYIDDAFTREQLRRGLADGRPERRDLLHIGTHFVLRPGEIGQSWLLLGDHGRLKLDELLAWQLRSVELVTLAACQTGASAGAQLEGLAAVMLERGAGAVVASLWPVNDRSTGTLMRALYTKLRDTADPAQALREAQLQLLRSGDARLAHPFHWAAFFVGTRDALAATP